MMRCWKKFSKEFYHEFSGRQKDVFKCEDELKLISLRLCSRILMEIDYNLSLRGSIYYLTINYMTPYIVGSLYEIFNTYYFKKFLQ